MEDRPRASWQRTASWLLVLLPFALYAVTLPRFGELQRNDYWGDFRQLLDGAELTHEPARWFQARSNEHRILAPLLLWTANIHLTDGDNRALSLVSLALLAATFAVLWRALPGSVRSSAGGPVGFGLPIAALLATPVAAHCWVMGFSGNQWYLANASAAAAIAVFARLRPDSSWRALLPALAFSLPGAFAHSTHLALWPALLLVCLVVPSPRGAAAFCAAATAAFLGLFLWHYAVPRNHPVPGQETASLGSFFASYLSLRASSAPAVARWWGLAGLILFALGVFLVLRRRRASRAVFAPWLALAVYALLNAAGTSVARAGFGESMALTSRYASLPALFWLGSLAILGLCAWEAPPRWRARSLGALALVTAMFLFATTRSGLELLRQHLKAVERQPLGGLAVLWRVDDDEALRTLCFSPNLPQLSRDFWRRIHHKPFDREAEWRLGEAWTGPPPPDEGVARGRWRRAQTRVPGFLSVSGNIRPGQGEVRRVVFLDREGRMRGGAVLVPPTEAPPPSLLRASPLAPSWFGYLAEECAKGVRPYAEVEERGEVRLEAIATADQPKAAIGDLCSG
jgi:hypothetical protein